MEAYAIIMCNIAHYYSGLQTFSLLIEAQDYQYLGPEQVRRQVANVAQF